MSKGSLVRCVVAMAMAGGAMACTESGEPLAVPDGALDAHRAAADASAGQAEGPVWQAILTPLNARTGTRAVTGKATFTLADGTLMATLDVKGVAPGQLHAQHIHGHDGVSTCPTPQADADGDGLVSVGEGAPDYGPVLVPLTPFPTPDGSRYHYEQSFDGQDDLEPERRAVVVHGAFVDGDYVVSLPVACGTIERVR